MDIPPCQAPTSGSKAPCILMRFKLLSNETPYFYKRLLALGGSASVCMIYEASLFSMQGWRLSSLYPCSGGHLKSALGGLFLFGQLVMSVLASVIYILDCKSYTRCTYFTPLLRD